MKNPNYYLVIDLEATCDNGGLVPREQMEIIEIGAVLVEGASFRALEDFQTFVKPVVHRTLTAFCMDLTKIRQEDVANAPTFPEAMRKLESWLKGRPALFGSWGGYDRKQFEQDARRYGYKLPFSSEHLNIKQAFADQIGARPMGMAQALRRAGLRLEGTHHRGIDDARNIAKLLPYALGEKRINA